MFYVQAKSVIVHPAANNVASAVAAADGAHVNEEAFAPNVTLLVFVAAALIKKLSYDVMLKGAVLNAAVIFVVPAILALASRVNVVNEAARLNPLLQVVTPLKSHELSNITV